MRVVRVMIVMRGSDARTRGCCSLPLLCRLTVLLYYADYYAVYYAAYCPDQRILQQATCGICGGRAVSVI